MSRKQAEQNERALDALQQTQIKQLKKNYEKALKDIRSQLAVLYESSDGSFVEAIKYNRLAKLEQQIGKILIELGKKNAENLLIDVVDTFEIARLREMYLIEKELGFAADFALMSPEAISKAVENPYDRVGIVNRSMKQAEHLADQIRQEVAQGLILGQGFNKSARKLRDRMEIDAGKARTIIRTETHRARGLARQETQEEAVELGIELKKMWLSTIDTSTRSNHRDLDGVTIDVDEEYESNSGGYGLSPGQMNTPEDDINCRCISISVIDGFEPTVRRVRGEGIVKFTTYREWEKTRPIPVRNK